MKQFSELQGSATIKEMSGSGTITVSQSKECQGCTTIKITARKCDNHKDCQEMQRSKELPGSASFSCKGLQGGATIE